LTAIGLIVAIAPHDVRTAGTNQRLASAVLRAYLLAVTCPAYVVELAEPTGNRS